MNNIKVFWDRKNGHIGTNIKSDDVIMCNEFDKLLCVERSGRYVIYDIPDKMHVGKLYDFRKYDAKMEFGVIYSEKKSGKFYGKRSTIDKFIKDKERDQLKGEALLPNSIGKMIKEDKCEVKVLETTAKWFGVTYAEDKPATIARI